MRQLTVNKNDAGQRLDKYLSKRFKTMPKSLMYKYLRTKYIKLTVTIHGIPWCTVYHCISYSLVGSCVCCVNLIQVNQFTAIRI